VPSVAQAASAVSQGKREIASNVHPSSQVAEG
jgi:hypothetical protein